MSKKVIVGEVENISLSAKQIKSKIEDAISYDHKKYTNTDIMFESKPYIYYKLPFSDFKISISEELANQQLLLENLNKFINDTKLIPDVDESMLFEEEVQEVIPAEENNINVVEEIYEVDDEDVEDEDDEEDDDLAQLPYDEKAKKPKRRSTIKVVDVQAIIEKIKREAIEKNKGKPVIGRRQINKMLKPYMLKRNLSMDIDGMEESLTSIDIYLNAVNKIANTTDKPVNENADRTLELNIKDILEDLEK